MPAPLYQNNCGYTPSGTAVGTQTLNPGPGAPGQGVASPETQGVLYGYTVTSYGGTGMVVSYLDIITLATSTVTNTLLTGTTTTNGQTIQGLYCAGIRYRGALVLVTSGTVGAGNSLWD